MAAPDIDALRKIKGRLPSVDAIAISLWLAAFLVVSSGIFVLVSDDVGMPSAGVEQVASDG